jgi:hypothetical protein
MLGQMLKGPLTLASFGLALNLFLWGIPGAIASSAAAHAVLPNITPTQSQTLTQLNGGSGQSIYTALMQLFGAESEAFQVAGDALRQPTPSDLVPRANAASAHVQDAAEAYIAAAQSLLNRQQ